MLDLRRLQMFRAVAAHRSFSKAALELRYTQSSISEGIATLERELGVTLLDRASRPVSLTPAGELVRSHADGLLGHARAVQEDLATLATGDTGTLRLAGFYTAWSTFLPAATADFTRGRPNVRLELSQSDPTEAQQRLRAGELDLAVIYRFDDVDPATDRDARLISTHVGHDAYALAVPTAHPLAGKRRLRVSDLADAHWCSAPRDSPATLRLTEFCREHGDFTPHLDYPTHDVAMAQPLIAAGLAVALLPSLELARPRPGVTVCALPHTPPGRNVWCLQPATRTLPPTNTMVDAIVRAAAAYL